MPSSIKSVFPAVIVASPLLLAATQPPAPDTMQLSCGRSGGAYREVIAPTSANRDGHVVTPVAASPQALVTSAYEWTAIWRDAAQALQIESQIQTMPNSLAFVEDTVAAAPTQAQNRCSSKEEPTGTSEPPSDQPSYDIPNLDPSVLPPVSPSPEPPAATPLPDESPSESPTESQPAGGVPDLSEPAPPPLSPPLAIPTRPLSPPPADPSLDPTNITPTFEPAAPFDGVVVPTLESLPDGVYRYLSGNYEYGVYSREQLIANGGSVFLLTKRANTVVGNFYPQFGRSGVCINGTVSGNSIVGPAYVIEAITVESSEAAAAESTDATDAPEVGDSYSPYNGIESFQVRQSQTVGSRISYADSLLDLSEYSRINAGTSLAPVECDVPPTVIETETESEAAE